MAESPGRLAYSGAAGLTADEAPLRPAPLRSHVAAQLRRPPAEIAAWAGHSVEVLMRTYARCVTGMEDVWIARMDKTLHPEEDQ
jgi:hypothetical protein